MKFFISKKYDVLYGDFTDKSFYLNLILPRNKINGHFLFTLRNHDW
nr:MAG TPA: hypothetical protein [Caudoviricetes sp.]